MTTERLQKLLSRAGAAPSRRAAEELIREGRVTVNGRVAEVGESADSERDAVKVDGKLVQPRRDHLYLLLNKPPGVMSTRSDPEGRPTILELIPPAYRKWVVPVGRLDFHTEGLVLLTDDGEFAQKVSHPRYGCKKTYEVKVKGDPEEKDLDRLRAGVVLDGRRTAPVRIEKSRGARGPRTATHNTWLSVELGEGRTRQIREMFFRIGHPVQRLRRVAIGALRDPGLRPGALRELTAEEVEMLASGRSAPKAKPASSSSRASRPKPASSKVGASKREGWAKPAKPSRGGKSSRSGKPSGAGRPGAGSKPGKKPSGGRGGPRGRGR